MRTPDGRSCCVAATLSTAPARTVEPTFRRLWYASKGEPEFKLDVVLRPLVFVFALGLPCWTTAACSIADIKVKWTWADAVNDDCATQECLYIDAVALVSNACSQPVGVEFRAIAYGKSGERVAWRDLWPARISNIPPGDYSFSFLLDYDPSIVKVLLQPIAVKDWWHD